MRMTTDNGLTTPSLGRSADRHITVNLTALAVSHPIHERGLGLYSEMILAH